MLYMFKKKLAVDSVFFHSQLFFRYFLRFSIGWIRNAERLRYLHADNLTQYCRTLRFSWTRWIPEWSDAPVSPAFPELPPHWTRGLLY